MKFKEARADHRIAQISVESNNINIESSKGLGTEETERPEGGKDKIYYSITTPEEERKNQEEEKEKQEKSLEMLRNIIIDQRRR